MHEIKIYGDIVHVSDKTDKNVSLADVQAQLALSEGKDIKVRINSDGGDVNEGFAIYYELRRYAKENNATVHTFAESRLSSIATVIFLGGDERELSTDLQPFVHSAYVPGNKELNEKEQSYLQTVNHRIAEHYAAHTELTFAEALDLMENETFIATEEAKAMRFATSIENVLRPVALQRFINPNLNIDMNKNQKTGGIMAKAEAFLKSVGLLAVNKMLATADEKELDFYELAEDAIVEVGAKVSIDGDKNVSSDHVMKSGETYKIVDGSLAEIVAVEDEAVNEEAVALQSQIDELTNQLEAVTNKAVDLEAVNKSQSALIANYKNAISLPAPNEPKPAPARGDAPKAKIDFTAAINKIKPTNK